MARERPTTPTRAPAATRIALVANPGSGSSDPDATARHAARLRRRGRDLRDRRRPRGRRLGRRPTRDRRRRRQHRQRRRRRDRTRPPARRDPLRHRQRLRPPARPARRSRRRLPSRGQGHDAARTGPRLDRPARRSSERTGGDERPFVNVASAGLPAPAARRADSWKRPLGALAYAAGALVAGVRERPLRCRVECDESCCSTAAPGR